MQSSSLTYHLVEEVFDNHFQCVGTGCWRSLKGHFVSRFSKARNYAHMQIEQLDKMAGYCCKRLRSARKLAQSFKHAVAIIGPSKREL